MDKDAYIKASEKQTTDMAAQRFILALAKQNPGLSQLFETTLGQIRQKCVHDDFKQASTRPC